MKQKTFITKNYYGREVKTLLTTFGAKNYSVGYFRNVDDLKAEETADFTKLGAAKDSIELWQGY